MINVYNKDKQIIVSGTIDEITLWYIHEGCFSYDADDDIGIIEELETQRKADTQMEDYMV